MNKSFPNLTEAHVYVEGLLRAGVTMQASRVWSDRFKKNKRDRIFMLLGVKKEAEKICARLSPGGQWKVEIEPPNTPFLSASVFGLVGTHTQHHRASAWYSHYLPYAYAMIKAEHGFRCAGVDFESINSYYGTCLGFKDMILDGSDRFDHADVELYSEICDHSYDILSPSLPFDEVFQPALVYVGIKAPHLLAQHTEKDHWQWKYVCQVIESMKRPVPKYRKTKPTPAMVV